MPYEDIEVLDLAGDGEMPQDVLSIRDDSETLWQRLVTTIRLRAELLKR